MKETIFDVNGIKLNVKQAGQGPALLLMHGWLGTSYHWRKLVPLLEKSFSLIMPDMRGHGDSSKPTSGYDAANLVEDMRELLKQLKVTKAFVAGHDMGALPAFIFASKYPAEVAGLIYIDEPLPTVNLPHLTSFTEETRGGYWHFSFNSWPQLPENLIAGKEEFFFRYMTQLMIADKSAISDEDYKEYLRTYAAPGGIAGSVGWYRAMFETNEQFREAFNQKLTPPVLAIGGEYGTPYTFTQLQPYCETISGTVYEKCGHMVAEEEPIKLANDLIKFKSQIKDHK
jgi:pimeloyl-ACP methyl ester carboxylesterase